MKKMLRSFIAVMLAVLCFAFCACKETPIEQENCENGHDMKQVGYTAPTCKTTGSKVFKCTRCDFTETETLLTIPCDYQIKSTIPSTCTTKGTQILECSMCHTPKTETLPLANHNYELQSSSLSTCLQFGKTVEKCSECEDEKITYNNQLLEHHFDETGYCSECGISEHYFDLDLRVGWDLGRITINLTPLFNNGNKNTADHWAAHTVYITLTCRDEYESDPPQVFQCNSQTNEDYSFWSFENENSDTPLHCSIRVGSFVDYMKTYTIRIACEGFETITQTFSYR